MIAVVAQGKKFTVTVPYAGTRKFDSEAHAQAYAAAMSERDPAKAQSLIDAMNAKFGK